LFEKVVLLKKAREWKRGYAQMVVCMFCIQGAEKGVDSPKNEAQFLALFYLSQPLHYQSSNPKLCVCKNAVGVIQ